MAFISLALILLALGLVLVGLMMLLMARGILQPPRMTDWKAIDRLHRLSPGDLGLTFENQNFTVRDARTHRPLKIAGWWIAHPAAAGRCAILIHGYADAKVGAIAWAPLLHELGLNILAIDLRAHGDSGGFFSTGGFLERDDLNQVIDQLLAARADEARQLILFGISLGAAVAAATAARREDINAVILESPFADYRRIVTAHVSALGMPTGVVLRGALRLAAVLSGADFDQVRPATTIRQTRAPLLIILGGDDELLEEQDVAALEQAVQNRASDAGPAEIITADNATHLMAIHVDPAGYAARISSFIEHALADREPHLARREHTPGWVFGTSD
ncbi:MAG TPA: alpha/beta fold hydrolase [Tepidisphaeraceae bacterium]|nr:alpha/beta fold hydrolase [Tepidisphaeraceae bacterium]